MFGQLSYLISESFRGWKQNHTVILPSLVTIFLCSALLAASFVALGGGLRLMSAEKSLYTIEAFLPGAVSDDSVAIIKNRLEHFRNIDSVYYVSADSALKDFRRHFSGEMLELVDGNPIPPFFRLTLVPEARNPVDLADVRHALTEETFFEEVQAPESWATRIAAWKFRMVFWPICISILLLVTLSLIIRNSVRLSLLSRRLLVENMKYAGGSYFFIVFPFVLEGIAQGAVGSGLSVLLIGLALHSVAEMLPILLQNMAGLGAILAIVVALVTLLSGYFSFRTVREFLLIKRNEQE